MNTNYVEFDLGKFYFSHRYNIYNKKDVLSKHIHDYYEIIFIKKGKFEYHFEDSVINVFDGVNTIDKVALENYNYYTLKVMGQDDFITLFALPVIDE